MKLFRFGPSGHERPGVLQKDAWLDVSAFGEDYGEEFFAGDGLARLGAWLTENQARCPKIRSQGPARPTDSPPEQDLVHRQKLSRPRSGNWFRDPERTRRVHEGHDRIRRSERRLALPRGSKKTDWEVELAVVIGKLAKYVSEEQALEHVAGYALHNDYSEREYQLERGGQWVKGKSADGFAPLGPLLVTPDEVDFRNLDLWLKVNGETRQSSNTSNMMFDVPTLISYLSRFMTLLPGDLISTGTPEGVGLGHKPPIFLKPGDVVELGIDGLGSAKQKILPPV